MKLDFMLGIHCKFKAAISKTKVFNWLSHVESIDSESRFQKKINRLFANFLTISHDFQILWFWNFNRLAAVQSVENFGLEPPGPSKNEIENPPVHRKSKLEMSGPSKILVWQSLVHRKSLFDSLWSIENLIQTIPGPSKNRSRQSQVHRFFLSTTQVVHRKC